MFLGFPENSVRPSRIGSNKDEKYHIEMARWTMAAVSHPLHRRFLENTYINWEFYKNRQWKFSEDLANFFMDDSGDLRHRIKVTKNIIQPIVEQYVGNMIKSRFKYNARSVSRFVKTRKEEDLGRMQFFTKVAQDAPNVKPLIKSKFNIGDTPEETARIFENTWVDRFEDTMNNFIRVLEQEVDTEDLKVQFARDMAISGMVLYKGFEQNGKYFGNKRDNRQFFFDRSAERSDLKDAEFMGEMYFQDAPSILERAQNLTDAQAEAIDKFSKSQQFPSAYYMMRDLYGVTGTKLPVLDSYWRDTEREEWGYILDENNYPELVNFSSKNNPYKKEHAIEPPTDRSKEIFKGKKIKKVHSDYLRYCIFIPKEALASAGDMNDIVFEYGILPYQPKETLDPSNINWPYKIATWIYDKGEIISPVDAVINPQRLINRMLSIAESQVNNAGSAGVAIARQALAGNKLGEEGIKRGAKKGDTLVLDAAKLGGIQNTIIKYDTTVGAGTQHYFNFIREVGSMVEDITGVNASMLGSENRSGELVGAIRSRISRGGIIQEPFYYAISRVMEGVYHDFVTRAKIIYADNPKRLAQITGEKGAEDIIITKEMKLEDFRIFLRLSSSDEETIETANGLVLQLLQFGLLDHETAANLFNRADAEDIAKAMRKYAKEKAEVAAKQAQQDVDPMALHEQGRQDAMYENEANRQNKLDQTLLKSNLKEAENAQKAMELKT